MGQFGRDGDDDVDLAQGTERIAQLSLTAERGQWIRQLQSNALRAVEVRDFDAARSAIVDLRASELDGEFDETAAALGAARDPESSEEVVADAVRRVCRLGPVR